MFILHLSSKEWRKTKTHTPPAIHNRIKQKLPFFSTVPLWWIHVRKKKRAAECKELQTIGLKHEKSIRQMLANAGKYWTKKRPKVDYFQ